MQVSTGICHHEFECIYVFQVSSLYSAFFQLTFLVQYLYNSVGLDDNPFAGLFFLCAFYIQIDLSLSVAFLHDDFLLAIFALTELYFFYHINYIIISII